MRKTEDGRRRAPTYSNSNQPIDSGDLNKLVFRNYLFLEKGRDTQILFTNWCFVSILVKISQMVPKKIFYITLMYFPYFVIISPWKNGGPFIWKTIESPSPKDTLCQVWLKLAKWFCRRFINFPNILFTLLVSSPLGKGEWPFIWTKLNPHYPRMLCTKFSWNWSCGSGEEEENVNTLQRRLPLAQVS